MMRLNAIMLEQKHTPYKLISEIIGYMHANFSTQPSLGQIGAHFGLNEAQLNALFRNWANITPKMFLQSLTLNHSKHLLERGMSLLDTSFEVGLSGSSRLHDLFVQFQAMPPGAYKSKAQGMTLEYGFAPSPFGDVLIVSSVYGLVGLSFIDANASASLEEVRQRWQNADFVENATMAQRYANRIFEKHQWRHEQPLKVVMIGSDFEIRVWETLLKLPAGHALSYGAISKAIGSANSARAVGKAVGHNPIAFVIPCHRVLGAQGKLTGYHWGLVRKNAILGWEYGLET